MSTLLEKISHFGGLFFDNCIVLNNCNKRMYTLYMLLILLVTLI